MKKVKKLIWEVQGKECAAMAVVSTYVEYGNWYVLVLKKNLGTRYDSVIISIVHNREAEDKAIGEFQVVDN